ncbi:ankyrin repeat domain-containing protein [Wolbachia endosymbiont of Drosophila aff. chauvacae BK-2020]|uniref:ankyrin repeat domain-containing protein n=1 Tax=unclassified Wolbachia TaxID=2640676 RepID=UPI0023A9CE46|nr:MULTISPECIES: ankyrin repeat domain-containing protein [unclassified Wolbachia]MDE5060073.1 ankyrin repeat domain-containing protein [Wolbachia endosymbiont of Drosophila burlai]MDE5063987.1 ankyrin repeat domain-containing protein [Wolbachia endosymbiont of Drosophila chauvacae]MDU8908755.1 ankyrin repeat domain-containing protein [Wolbachia endosymbiont of Drosophila bocqueti]WOE62266.1 ankyrin repeat domain-containing protein [Wolbachia endosymbiont of Drosophila aff. chauvacae BK-2020]
MLYGGDGINTNGYRYNQTTSRQLDEPTQKLFKAIDNENPEAFKQALKEGADVNAFDKEGMTPLMSIVNVYPVSGGGQATLEKMAKLLIQNRSININAQSKQSVSTTGTRYNPSTQSEISGFITTSNMHKDTALHIACQVGAKDVVKILLTHPDIKTGIKNYEYKSPEDCIARGFERVIKLEFKKAQKANELLGALSSRNIYQAKRPLNQEFNPNCWKRSRNEEIETPLSLIIQSCLQGITSDNKEVLTKLLKHKELDFSSIKPIQAIEQNSWVKQIIEQAITERLTATINKKDLDDVKKLVEDNCFMSHAIVTAALRGVNNPIESITNYLNEKFPANTLQPLASTNDIPVGSEQVIQELKGELERTKAQLIEKERELDRVVRERTRGINKISQLEEDLRQEKSAQKTKINDLNSEVTRLNRIVYGRASDTVEISRLKRDLKQVREERDRLSSENRLLRSNKNEKSSQAISSGRKLSNYASACFILLGVYTVVACLVIEDYPGIISAFFTAVALAFFLLGCYSLYKVNTILSDVESTQLGGLERS